MLVLHSSVTRHLAALAGFNMIYCYYSVGLTFWTTLYAY